MLEKRWRVCEEMQGLCGVLEFIPVHLQAGLAYKRRVEPAPRNAASALVCGRLGRAVPEHGIPDSVRGHQCSG